RDRAGHVDAGPDPGPAAADPAPAEGPARPGNDLPEVPAKAAAQTLRDRGGAGGGLAPFPERRADPGPARDGVGARLEVDAAAPGLGGVDSVECHHRHADDRRAVETVRVA